MQVSLRSIEPADQPFLRALYESTRVEELAGVGWDEEHKAAFIDQQFFAQTAHYAEHYEGMSSDIVLVDGTRAGRLLVARWNREIRIVDISLLPDFRGRGVGTGLLRELQEEASGGGRPLSIHVEKFNPAMRLYERLGFKPAEDKGVYLLMEWSGPATGVR